MNQVMNPVMIADCSCVFFAKHQTPGDMAHGRELAAKNTKRIYTGYKGVAMKVDYDPNHSRKFLCMAMQ